MLIFDEATSALDNEVEQEITDAIRSISRDKTILIVAHRLSTIRNCDELIFLSEGEVQAIGTYDELVKTNGKFRQLASLDGANHPELV